MIKGKSTIQLFNAASGAEELRITNENMVTNAMTNALNLPIEYTLQTRYQDLSNWVLPLQTNGMGGILLWDKMLPENPDLIFPPADVRNIGYAGGEYSGTNQYRGTLNTSESGEIANGYRSVWDFSTDKANGEIYSLSLTSREGGNTGLYYNSNDNLRATALKNNITYNGPSGYSAAGVLNHDNYAAYRCYGNTLYLAYAHCHNTKNIKVGDALNVTPVVYLEKTIEFTLNQNRTPKVLSLPNKPTIYCFTMLGTNSVWFAEIDYSISSLIQEQVAVLKLPDDYSSVMDVIGTNDDGIYVTLYLSEGGSTPYTVGLFDFSGNFVKRVTPLSFGLNQIGSMCYCANRWWFYAGGTYYSVNNGECMRSDYNPNNFYAYNNGDISPFFIAQTARATYSECALWIYHPYLATINNLATPVTKTNAQTMKITYEITNESTEEG